MSGDFVLDRAENPHPRMLQKALLARTNARVSEQSYGPARFVEWRNYWRGYLAAMADATGCEAAEIEAWMDAHAVPESGVNRTGA